MRIVLLLVFILQFTITQAQQWAFEMWHDGKVILATGDTLKGMVKYDPQQDIIQYNNQKGSVEALSARKVLYYEIFDNTVNQYRQFYALPFNTSGGYRAPVFFELLTEGKLTLLSRENLEYRTYSSPYYFGSYTRLVLVYKYYFLDERGNINEFVPKKIELLNMMGNWSKAIDAYMKENKLRVEERSDLTRIVAYYNSIVKS